MVKLAASILSRSMSIISSVVDSVVDLLSGVIMWWAARAIKRRNIYDYPQGETALSRVSQNTKNLQIARAIYVIIHMVRQRCHMLTTKSIAVKRRYIYDYAQGETALSRMCKPPKQSCLEAEHLIIHRVRQRCHVLATKPGTYKLPALSNDYPHGETALSHVSYQVHSHQETEHL